MAEENDAEEPDVEAEMLRMMQEELGGDDAGGGEEAAEGGDDGIDNTVEAEMLQAMETEGGGDTGNAGDPMAALAALGPALDPVASASAEGIDRLTDVDVEITVELGENHVAIQDIMTWTAGSVVELIDEESEPVNVMLNGSLFAKGEIVVVGDTFGVRIVELLDPPDDATM